MKQFVLLIIAILGAHAQQAPPAIVIRPPDSSATETQTARFTCAAYGLPLPTITWTQAKGGLADKLADANSGYRVSTETLVINDVAFSMSILEICGVVADTADQYTCTATNGSPGTGVADSAASFNLAVSPAAKQPPAIITTSADTSNVEYGTSVEAFCVAYGNPLPTITWDKPSCPSCANGLIRGNGTATTTNQVVSYGDVAFIKSTLSLCGVADTDSGAFRCTAANGITGNGISNATGWWTLAVNPEVRPTTSSAAPTATAGSSTLTATNERAYQGVVAFETIFIVFLILVIVALVVFILIKSRQSGANQKPDIPRPPRDPRVRKDGFENPLHGDQDDAVDVDTMTYADLAKRIES